MKKHKVDFADDFEIDFADSRTKEDRLGKVNDFKSVLVTLVVINAILMMFNVFLMNRVSTLLAHVI